MPLRHRNKLDPQVTLVDRLWVVALLVVGFADVIAVLYILPLFD
ncbi:MAG TPA: hypothetical protein VG318_01590 [Actinomycetota bacterium]|nr:hypothetical protein [Actinomycetota bacterium]